MSKKTPLRKARLVKAQRSARPVPIFVRMKTARKVTMTPGRRHWRTIKLKFRD